MRADRRTGTLTGRTDCRSAIFARSPAGHVTKVSPGTRREKPCDSPETGGRRASPETAPGGCHPSRSTDSATSATTASTSPTVSIGPGTTAKITSDSTIVMSGASPCIGEMMIALP